MQPNEDEQDINSQQQPEDDLSIDHVVMSNKDTMSDRIKKKLEEIEQTNHLAFNLDETDLIEADDNHNKPLAIGGEGDIQQIISSALEKYNAKYGTNLTWQSMQEYLLSSIAEDQEEQRIKKVITDDMMAKLCDYNIFKSFIMSSRTMDIMLENLQRKKYTQDITEEGILIMDRAMKYRQEYEELKKRYRVFDVQSSIDSIRANSTKKLIDKDDTLARQMNDIMNAISSSLQQEGTAERDKENKKNKNNEG